MFWAGSLAGSCFHNLLKLGCLQQLLERACILASLTEIGDWS